MWNKIKPKLPIVCMLVVIGCLFYFNHQRDNQLKEMIDQLKIESSHHRTDIIHLESGEDALTSTMIFWKKEIFRQNDIFKEETIKDIEHEIGMMESKLSILEDIVERYSSQNDRFSELMQKDYQTFITALDTTLHITGTDNKKGTQSLQQQIDQLRLEFNELIQKLEEHKRTRDIFQ